jgi:hypothetical protein
LKTGWHLHIFFVVVLGGGLLFNYWFFAVMTTNWTWPIGLAYLLYNIAEYYAGTLLIAVVCFLAGWGVGLNRGLNDGRRQLDQHILDSRRTKPTQP